MSITFTRLSKQHLPMLNTWHIDDANRWLGHPGYPEELLKLQNTSIDRHCFVALDGEMPIGIVDLEVNGDGTAWMSLFVRPDTRGKGTGKSILKRFLHEPAIAGLTELKVEIEHDNVAGLRCFESAGFVRREEPDMTEGFFFLGKKMKRVSARAILMIDGKVLLIHRRRDGREYWVMPGGGVEEGETFEQAVKREVKEEVGIDIDVGEKVLQVTNNVYDSESEQHFFVCTYIAGNIGTGDDPRMLNPDPSDFSEVVLVDRKDAENMNIVPPEVKEIIVGLM